METEIEITEFDQPNEIISKLETQLYAVEEYYTQEVKLYQNEIKKANACIAQYHAMLIEYEQANHILKQALYALATHQEYKLIMQEIECLPQTEGDE